MSHFSVGLRYVRKSPEKLKFKQMSDGSSRCEIVRRVSIGHVVAEGLEFLYAGVSTSTPLAKPQDGWLFAQLFVASSAP